MTITENTSLLPYNTFGIEAKTDYLVEYDSVEDLQKALQLPVVKSNPLLAVGEGSNLLFLTDFHGVVLHSAIRFINVLKEDDDEVIVEAGSGINWDDFVAYCVEQGWYGVENLSLIPGEVGAAAVQNIGAYGVEVKDVILEVRTVDIENAQTRHFSAEECRYGYRESIFKNQCKGKYIVTSLVMKLSKKETYCFNYQHLEASVREKGEITLPNVRRTIIEIRESKLPDPKVQGNAGSFFKNPVVTKAQFLALQEQYPAMPHYFVSAEEEKLSAAWLIDQSGLKGKHLGNAGVHHCQPLVLVNLGKATGQEIVDLANLIQQTVKEKFGIELHPEVNYI